MRVLRKRSVAGAIASIALLAAMAPGVASAAAPTAFRVTVTCIAEDGIFVNRSSLVTTEPKDLAGFQVLAAKRFRDNLVCAKVTIEREVLFPV